MANNEFTIPIPARLKNVAKGGHVAGAKDIIDDALGKEQSEINQERIDDIAEVKGGSTKSIADISEDIAAETERASGVEAGLRESIDELGQIGLNPDNAISTNGDDFDGDTTAKRSKIPTIGAIIDGNPGVYDVSKRNPTGGPNSDGKFTLAYILANADTLIPTSRRHGGMEICFVQSSDNNYVQFFCMAQNFTTDVTQWQGVDDEPTAGSKKLMNGKAVYDYAASLLAKNKKGYYVNRYNSEGESEYWQHSPLIPCTNKDKIIASTSKNNSGICNYIAYDSSLSVVGTYDTASNVETIIEPNTLPSDTAYILFNASIDYDLYVLINGLQAYDILGDINKIKRTINDNNTFQSGLLAGVYYNKQGEYARNEGMACSGFIPCDNTKHIVASTSKNAPLANNYLVFDSNKGFIQGYDMPSGVKVDIQENTLPSNTAYIVFNCSASDTLYVFINDLLVFNAGGYVVNLQKEVDTCDMKDNMVFGVPRNYYYNLSGEDGSYEGLVSTPLIPVTNENHILLNTSYNGLLYKNIVFFDSEKLFISGIDWIERNMPYMFMPSDIPSNAAYFGVNFKDTEEQVIYVDDRVVFNYSVAHVHKFAKKKLITIGDSLTSNTVWQRRLMLYTNMIWSAKETGVGVGYVNINDGTYTTEDKSGDSNYRRAHRMAYAGTAISPSADTSIYIRSLDAKYYNPDIIIIYAGENDPVSTWKSSGNTGTTPDEIVARETPYTSRQTASGISAISAYKGMIENLMADCPSAIIYIVCSMRIFGEVGKEVGGVVVFPTVEDVKTWESVNREPKVEYMKAIARFYNLPLISLWDKSGINNYNAKYWYQETDDSCIQIHPNSKGYDRIADVVLQCL